MRYKVQYAFGGFFPPLVNPPASLTAGAHSVVPARFSLADVRARSVSATSAVRSITVQAVAVFSQADPAHAVPATSAPGTQLTYSSGSRQFTFWWLTPKAPGRVVLFVTLDDGTVHQANVTLAGVHRLDDDFVAHVSMRDD